MFTQAISASSSTISSVPSTLTSTYPDVHGIWEFGNFLDPTVISLEGVLRENNFFTGIISAQLFPHLTSRGDFISKKIKLDAKANEITDWAIEWLGKNKNKRFFLYLHYFDPHGPYTPPPPYDEIYLKDKFYERGIEVPLLNRQRGGFGGVPGYQAQGGIKDKNYYIAEYDGEIRFTDSQIGRLINVLEETGLLYKTIIIITSDHGESLGEHDYYFDHGAYLYDNLFKVRFTDNFIKGASKHIKGLDFLRAVSLFRKVAETAQQGLVINKGCREVPKLKILGTQGDFRILRTSENKGIIEFDSFDPVSGH